MTKRMNLTEASAILAAEMCEVLQISYFKDYDVANRVACAMSRVEGGCWKVDLEKWINDECRYWVTCCKDCGDCN